MNVIKELKNLAKNYTVLIVDDDPAFNDNMALYLKNFFSKVDIAFNGKEGLSLYERHRHDIILTDIDMPVMNGLEMSKAIREINKDQEIVIISAYYEADYFMDSIKIGISGYMIKPVLYDQLNAILFKIVDKLEKYKENEAYKLHLEEIVAEKTKDLVEAYESTQQSLITMIEERDTYTGGHSERVAYYCRIIAEKMGYSDDACDLIFRAGILHDIGKIATPDSILLKPGQLDPVEYQLIQEHVKISYELLRQIPMYKDLAEIVRNHHEHYDGSGYPQGLKGDDIPPLSRIMIVADAFDAMTTSRIYKARKSIPTAIDEIQALSGIHFHPDVVGIASEVLKSINVEKHISQFPISNLELERFAYYYHDQVAGINNQNYLDLILNKNHLEKTYSYLDVILMHNFTSYNEKYGWEQGDILLKSFAKILQTQFPDALLFRIHGDDFVLLNQTKMDIDIDKLNDIDIIKTDSLLLTLKKFDIVADKIYSNRSLEMLLHHSH